MNPTTGLAWIKLIAVVIIGGLLAWLLYKGWGYLKKAGTAVGDAATAAKNYVTGGDTQHNVISRAVDSAVGADSTNSTLGTKIYDWFHPGDNANINAPVVLDNPAQSKDVGTDNSLPTPILY